MKHLNSISTARAYWDKKALDRNIPKEFLTHPDFNQRRLEIDFILQRMPSDCRLLDVGCGNGFSTSIFSHHVSQAIGIDRSKAMIKRANRELGGNSRLEFQVMDVLSLHFPPHSFDVAVSSRCLINLRTWRDQQKAIVNIARVLKSGAYFFLQEGSQQGKENLNQLREKVGLRRMPPVVYNLDFDEEKLWDFIRRDFEIIEAHRLGVYDLMTRVLHPLLVYPEEPRYEAKINEMARKIASQFESAAELSREFCALLRRR